MAEQSGFFDARLVNGEYDRTYLADSFAKYFASFIGNGVFAGKSNELMVQQMPTANMTVSVISGQGWINGYWYENTSTVYLPIDNADGVLNRIDLVVLRWDNSERVIRLAVKKGTPASNATAPTLRRTADFYELKLAEVTVKAGTTKITQANILDTRLDNAVCGFVHAVVEQFDASKLGTQLNTYINEFIAKKDEWFNQFKINSESAVNSAISTGDASFAEAIRLGNLLFDEAIAQGSLDIANLISEKGGEIDELIDRLQQASDENAVANVIGRLGDLEEDVEQLKAQEVVSPSTRIDKRITVEEWAADYFELTSDAITATSIVELVPGDGITRIQLEALQLAQVVGGEQEAGKIQIKCLGEKPTIAIPVIFIVRGDL